MKSIRLALVLQNSIPGNTDKNLESCLEFVKKAALNHASIITFPEMNITGYLSEKKIIPLAETIPGKITDTLCCEAKDKSITILAGMAEKDINGNIFASHFAALPDGSVFVYRKIHIAPPEKAIFSKGDKIEICKTHNIKFGIQLCYDAHFPELSTSMAVQGADLIFIPHASPRGTPEEKFESWMRHLRARAFDNGLFIAACNQVGENRKGLFFPGVAVVIGPDGNIIEKYTATTEKLVLADIEQSMLNKIRNHKMRYFLPNRRDDLFNIL